MHAALEDWIALSLLPGLGPLTGKAALTRWRDPATIAYRVPAQYLEALKGYQRQETSITQARRDLRRRAERELRRCEKRGIRVLPLTDPDYPAELEQIDDPPLVLYMQGEWRPGVVRVAVVGSRRCTRYGSRVACGLASGLAERGIEIVSGGAWGIDTHAHRGALEAGGRTLAVLGAGMDHPYPSHNEELFRQIADNGALITEFPVKVTPKPENFPRRNRVISGLSLAVVVVEAASRSGSLVTARHALEQNRELLAIPGPVSSVNSAGCNRLIREGATLVQNVDDVIEELSPIYRAATASPAEIAPNPRHQPRLEPDERQLLALLDPVEPIQLERIADEAPFGIGRLQAALFGLEMAGVVERLPGGFYRKLSHGDPRGSA